MARRPRSGPLSALRLAALAGVVALLACDGPAPIAEEAGADDPLLARISSPVAGGEVALVRMVAQGGAHAFEPAEIRVRAGDVVRFVLVGPRPESVAFDSAGPPPEGVSFLRERGLLGGPLLTEVGQVYDVSFEGAPPGRYPFRSLPHAELGMRGTVVVEPAR